MRHISTAQLRDLSSQAYLMIDVLADLKQKEVDAYPLIEGVSLPVRRLKKQLAKDLLAKALGYTSWSHLTLRVKGSRDKFDPVTVFRTVEEAEQFFAQHIPSYKVFCKELCAWLPAYDESVKYPFVKEICEAYDVRVTWVDEYRRGEFVESGSQYITLSAPGDRDVGIQPFMSGLYFSNEMKLERFIQRHIETVRSDYVCGENMDRVFDSLVDKYKAEEVAGAKTLEDIFHSKVKCKEYLTDYLRKNYLDENGMVLSNREEALVYQFYCSVAEEFLPVVTDSFDAFQVYYDQIFSAIESLTDEGVLKCFSSYGDACSHYELVL